MPMQDLDQTIERLFELLISGDRNAARQFIDNTRASGISSRELASSVFWPTYERIDRLFRHDQITVVSHRLATRLLRVLVDQNSAHMHLPEPTQRSVLAFCGPDESDEIGAQIAVDLLETEGFRVTFGGGGVPRDEILGQVHERRPDVLLMFCSAPGDLPAIRGIIDSIREISACPNTQFAVGGGVFNRAEGLAEEIGADLWASDPIELAMTLIMDSGRRAIPDQQRTVGRVRRRAA